MTANLLRTIQRDHELVRIHKLPFDDHGYEHYDPYTGEAVVPATGYPAVPAPQPLRSLRLA